MLNHPTGLFRETIIRPLGGAGPSNFYTPYNSPKCISSRTWGAGRPHVGLCPIFLGSFCFTRFLISHRIFELRRPIAAKLCTVISICVNFLMQVQKLRGPPLKYFTPAKFWVDFTQLTTFIANISGTSQDIQNRKDMWSRTIPPAFSQRSPVNFVPLFTEQYMWVWKYPSRLFSTDYISALTGCWPLKFLHALDFDKVLLAHIANPVGDPPENF